MDRRAFLQGSIVAGASLALPGLAVAAPDGYAMAMMPDHTGIADAHQYAGLIRMAY